MDGENSTKEEEKRNDQKINNIWTDEHNTINRTEWRGMIVIMDTSVS